MSLTRFKSRYLDTILDILWKQWASIGVAGQYGTGRGRLIVDPEALLLFSGTMARYDQRLFDEMLDWLVVNNRFINIQRLKTLLKNEGFQSGRVISAVAGFLANEKSGLKWKSLAGENHGQDSLDSMFFMNSGQDLPVPGEIDPIFSRYGLRRNPIVLRGMSEPFPGRGIPSLLLQIRSILGIGARSEILLYMLLNNETTISRISEQTYYAWRSVQDVLFEWGHTPMIDFPAYRRGRTYRLHRDSWSDLLGIADAHALRWVCWPALYRSLEIIWKVLNDESVLDSGRLEQAAELKHVHDFELKNRLFQAGLSSGSGRLEDIGGKAFIDVWIQSIDHILQGILADI